MADASPAAPRRRRPVDRETFGERLRTERRARGWTLAELARRSGVSIPTISRAERGQLALGYDNFQALARALELDLGALFTPASAEVHPFREPVVTRAGHGSIYRGTHSTYEFLAVDALGKRMIPAAGTVHARQFPAPGDEAHHAGEEFIYVLSGTVELRLGSGRTVRLAPGDAVYLDSRLGHAYRSVGRQLARVVAVMTAEPGDAPDAALAHDAADRAAVPAATGAVRRRRTPG